MPANAVSITATYKDIKIIDAVCNNELIFDVYTNPASNFVIVSSSETIEYMKLVSITGNVVLVEEVCCKLHFWSPLHKTHYITLSGYDFTRFGFEFIYFVNK